MFLAYALLLIPSAMINAASQELSGRDNDQFAIFVALFIGEYLIAIFLHEMGHAAAVLIAGWSVEFIAVFPLGYRLKTARLGWWLTPYADFGGVVMFRATHNRDRARWLSVVAAGGPAVSLVTGAVCTVMASALLDGAAATIVGSFGAVSFFIGLGNLIPFRVRGVRSDGAQLLFHLRQA